MLASGGAAAFAFDAVRPNPAAGAWTLAFTLERSGDVSGVVSGIAGRIAVRSAWRGLGAGAHVVPWSETAGLAPGLYFVSLRQGDRVATRRAVRINGTAP